MISIPRRLEEVTAFQAMEIFQLATQLEAQGQPVIHLEFGEPDFPTPQMVQEAGAKAITGGRTHYTSALGLLALRQEICNHYQQRYGVTLSPDQVLVSQGTSLLTQILMLMLLEPGDQVILTDPAYACYANYVRIAGGEPVFVTLRESEGFQVNPEAVRRAITPRTRALMVCSPANPTGNVMKPEVLLEIAALGIPVISDEIYHGLTYVGEEHTVLEYTDQAFVLNGFSKYFAMTGWRLGYLIFPPQVQNVLNRLHANIMISAAEPAQVAGLVALQQARPICEGYRAEYDRRRRYMILRLKAMGLPMAYEPDGAFYCFVNARHLGANSLALARDILLATGVALTPGIDFGPAGEGYLRFSYANAMENIALGLDRLETYIQQRK